MTRRNILVVLQANTLTGVQHAMALAGRMTARVFILRIVPDDSVQTPVSPMDEILKDLLADAQLAGIEVSYHTCDGLHAGELRTFVRTHGISLVVIGEEGGWLRRELERPHAGEPPLGCQIVEARAKEPTKKDP